MESYNIKKVMVIGAGTMGHSIAQVYAQNGRDVILIDKNKKILDRALELIEMNLNTLAKYNRVKNGEISNIIKKISFLTDLKEHTGNIDMVIEAVNEVPEIKRMVYREINNNLSKDAIIASNTSGLDIFNIADIDNPERLIIHHWFNPAHIIPLVEIVPGKETSERTIKISKQLIEALGKKSIILKQFVSNFIVNRIQRVIMVQTWELMQKGWATAEQIDLAIKHVLGIRLPVQGIVQSQDFNGLDLILDKQKEFRTNKRYPQVENLVNQGYLGVKSGRGFYDYKGKTEKEIVRIRDEKCLQILDYLEKINALELI